MISHDGTHPDGACRRGSSACFHPEQASPIIDSAKPGAAFLVPEPQALAMLSQRQPACTLIRRYRASRRAPSAGNACARGRVPTERSTRCRLAQHPRCPVVLDVTSPATLPFAYPVVKILSAEIPHDRSGRGALSATARRCLPSRPCARPSTAHRYHAGSCPVALMIAGIGEALIGYHDRSGPLIMVVGRGTGLKSIATDPASSRRSICRPRMR